MHQDLEVLAEELKLIRDNCYGDLKPNSTIYLTHSEVISFIRTCVQAIEKQIINPFSGWDFTQQNQIMFFLNLIRTNGICHRDRSRAAQRCLNIIEHFLEQESKKKVFWIPRTSLRISRMIMIGMTSLFNFNYD